MESGGDSVDKRSNFKISKSKDRVVVKKMTHVQMKAFKRINFYKSEEPEVEKEN